jgi:hypothetical protein
MWNFAQIIELKIAWDLTWRHVDGSRYFVVVAGSPNPSHYNFATYLPSLNVDALADAGLSWSGLWSRGEIVRLCNVKRPSPYQAAMTGAFAMGALGAVMADTVGKARS